MSTRHVSHPVLPSFPFDVTRCGAVRYPFQRFNDARRAQELRRRFAAAGSSATAFSVNPGAVRSDIWRHIPKFVMPVFDFLMRTFFINTEQGCCTSVCAAAMPLERLPGTLALRRPFFFFEDWCLRFCVLFG